MRNWMHSRLSADSSYGKCFLTSALVLVFLILCGSHANALPAFARPFPTNSSSGGN